MKKFVLSIVFLYVILSTTSADPTTTKIIKVTNSGDGTLFIKLDDELIGSGCSIKSTILVGSDHDWLSQIQATALTALSTRLDVVIDASGGCSSQNAYNVFDETSSSFLAVKIE